MQPTLIILSSALALLSPLVYAKAILRGEAKPHRTTRLVLLVISALATLSLFAQNDRVAVWLAAVSTLQSVVVFGLSIRNGIGGWEKKDMICLAVALLGIVLWQTTQNPAIALYASIAADFTGMVPALVKTYHFPKTEVWTFYSLDVAASVLSLLAVNSLTLQQTAYPAYIMVVNCVMVGLILRPRLLHDK